MRMKSVLMILIFLVLTGCTSSGIHIYSIRLVGEVRESSVLQQPVKDVEIRHSSGELLGMTDSRGQFSVEVLAREGKIPQIILQHPDYHQQVVSEDIEGKYQEVINLPPFYLVPAGGVISGQVQRVIPNPWNRAEQVSVPTSKVVAAEMDRVELEYNLVTDKGREWLAGKLVGRGEIVSEVPATKLYTIRLLSEEDEKVILKNFTLSEDVEYIEPNCFVYLQRLTPEDEMLPFLWNMQMINAVPAWQHAAGLGVKVAVLDSLFMSRHPDLARNMLSPLDVYNNVQNDQRLGKHGTHVAGIIGAVADRDGVIGVAPYVSILPIRVFKWNEFGSESATIDAIAKGIHLAVEEGAQVINMSFGMSSYNLTLHDAIKKAYAAGIVLVAASGNNGGSQLLYPAAFPEVIGVGAVGPDEKRAYYSQYGPGIELMAPGGNLQQGTSAQILSTMWDEALGYTWTYEQGTSMAVPHVSGLAALLISYGIADPDYIRLILRETAKDLGAYGYDEETGYGLIDAESVLALFQHSYVFFGSVDEGYAQLRSQVVQVEVNGDYTLTGVRPGEGRVIGWTDVNDNLLIDAGDYLDQSELQYVAAEDTVLTGVDLALTRVDGDFQAIDIKELL